MKTLCWIRRDLRLHDHGALSAALEAGDTLIVFNFDPAILSKLKKKEDRRVTFIMESLQEMEKELQKRGSSLLVCFGDPVAEIPRIAQEHEIEKVFANRDYEPYAKHRDQKVAKKLADLNIEFLQFKDAVMYEKHEVQKGGGGIYKVFTPYKNAWLQLFENQGRNLSEYPCPLKKLRAINNPKNVLDHDWHKEIGFIPTSPLLKGGTSLAVKRLKSFEERMPDYKEQRNYPAVDGTSYLSVYIRFGNISIRDLVRASLKDKNQGAETWLSELVWRDFYQMLLDSHPELPEIAFKPEYDQIKWLGSDKDFKAWCEGETGFPIIDAAMRCFNATGMMHNRLRMVTASFLCKILLVDWRLGEKYFAENLLDYDLAANNGGWQWSSSSGCDAQPYFRIFNPYAQSEKFDSEGEFIREWCPELAHLSSKVIHRPDQKNAPDYPKAIVDYQKNRASCLLMYSAVRKS
jgi:deoxyribodipyrimidine photo-lyase